MKKWQWIARWVSVMLVVGSGRAWAQETCPRPEWMSEAQWNVASAEQQAAACRINAKTQKSADEWSKYIAGLKAEVAAKTAPPTWKAYSPKLQLAGAVSMVVGVIQMLPYGDHYKIFGTDVCVSDYEVDYGTCARPRAQVLVGAAMVGTGFALFKIGGRRVAIRPVIASQQRSVSATLRW